MGFGNSKRMDLVKDLMKDEKKKKLAKKKAMARSSSASSMSSRHSTRSGSTNGSSTGADDPFHIRRVMKVQRLWDKVVRNNEPVPIGETFLKKILAEEPTEEQSKVLVETLDLLIGMLGPDMDEEDVEEAAASLDHQCIPAAALGEVFADIMNDLLDKTLSEKEMVVLDSSMGMVLRDMLGA